MKLREKKVQLMIGLIGGAIVAAALLGLLPHQWIDDPTEEG
jgi:hypothetical protein